MNNGGLFGLLETKIKALSLNSLNGILVDGWSITTKNRWHKGGRIWIVWNPAVFQVDFLDYSAQCINMRVIEISTNKGFVLSMVYAFNDLNERRPLWEQLLKITGKINEPWVVCGDFNCVLSHSERLGGDSLDAEIDDFQQCLDRCALVDGPAIGSFFTWNNKQELATRVYSRLDRVLINYDWGVEMNDMYANFLPEGTFDHTPCLIQSASQHRTHRKPFKYYAMWGKSPFIPNLINWWKSSTEGTNMFKLVHKLKHLKSHMRRFNKDHFDDIDNCTIKALKNLEYIQTKVADDPRDVYWLVKEKQAHEEVKDLQQACTAARTDPVNHHIIKRGKVCNEKHWVQLLTPVTPQEIRAAIFSIPDHKAPGLDGYSSSFFKDSWSIIGNEVSAAIMDVFAIGKLLKQLNATTLTLIPKCKMPNSVTQFRPIACCNVLYKCISKLICNRLAKVLPGLFSMNQGGFINGRSIIENIMICQDLVKLYNRQAFSSRYMFKMDLIKAYHSVSWRFLGDYLTAFNFPGKFKHLVMERALRQGDPISPLLFTLCMEYLSRILACAIEKMQFSYHPLCKQMKLTHLIFADDYLMFCKGNAQSMVLLLRAFSAFSNASGLKMNPQKYRADFNGVHNGLKQEILSISGFLEGTLPFKYLGVPITAGRLKIKDCASLIDKIVNRVRSLGAKKLSFAGRHTLVSSVLATMHTYWASMFVLPKGVIKRVDAICRNYLWEGGVEYNKTPLLVWQKVCSPKKEGGLGLKWSLNWNIATVGKLAWCVATKPDKLWVQWVHHVYMKDNPWLDYIPSSAVSWHWKKVCQVRDILKQGYWTDRNDGIYIVKGCYNWLREMNEEVICYKPVWCFIDASKDSFIAWLFSHQALRMKDRLYEYNVASDNLCCLCAMAIESHTHVLQDCVYTKQVMQLVTIALGAYLSFANVLQQRVYWLSIKGVIRHKFRCRSTASIGRMIVGVMGTVPYLLTGVTVGPYKMRDWTLIIMWLTCLCLLSKLSPISGVAYVDQYNNFRLNGEQLIKQEVRWKGYIGKVSEYATVSNKNETMPPKKGKPITMSQVEVDRLIQMNEALTETLKKSNKASVVDAPKMSSLITRHMPAKYDGLGSLLSERKGGVLVEQEQGSKQRRLQGDG
ncbi:uncharacterized protein LOC141628514 [Silene latifolia]|uniref:uncharacterized protein LOC141628514 n=1 Tax=Silene latifolia TaxID=37657 RepID=UPI003D76E78A